MDTLDLSTALPPPARSWQLIDECGVVLAHGTTEDAPGTVDQLHQLVVSHLGPVRFNSATIHDTVMLQFSEGCIVSSVEYWTY